MLSHVEGHKVIYDPAEAYRLLSQDTLVGFDAETTGFNPWRNSLALLQFYGDDTGTLALIRTPNGVVPEAIVDLLETRGITMVGHNIVAFDIPFLSTHDVNPFNITWYDTMVAETAIIPTGRRDVSVSLRATAKRRLGVEIDKNVEHSNWSAPKLSDDQVLYAADDVLHLPALYRSQQERAIEAGVLRGLDLEQELIPAVASMTITGLPLNEEKYREYIEEQHRKRDIAFAKIKDLLPTVKNWRSPKQIGEALYALGVPLPKTKSGQRSTARETLERFARYGGKNGQLIRDLMAFRTPDQRIKMYTEEWLADFQEADGRIHAKFWQCSTDTTRFSSSEPNLQQVPKDMRYVFGWVSGHTMVTLDYSQIEVLITASIAGDQAMLDHIAAGVDFHAAVGEDVLGIPIPQQTIEDRRFAKAVVFTMLFGGSPKRIVEYAKVSDLSIGESEIYAFVDLFFEKYPGIYRMRQMAQTKAQGWPKVPVTINIPSGLKRTLRGKMVRSPVIINTMVQSSAAVGIKYGMLNVWTKGIFYGNVCAQIHDELPSCVPDADVDDFIHEMKVAMSTGMTKAIDQPCTVEAKTGDGWPK